MNIYVLHGIHIYTHKTQVSFLSVQQFNGFNIHTYMHAYIYTYIQHTQTQVSFLSAQQMNGFNNACLQLLRTFAHVEDQQSHAAPAAKLVMELRQTWLRNHLLSLLQLLLHLARKDVVDFASETRCLCMYMCMYVCIYI